MAKEKPPETAQDSGTTQPTTDAEHAPTNAAPANEPAKNVHKPEDSKVIGNWPKTLPGHPPAAPGR